MLEKVRVVFQKFAKYTHLNTCLRLLAGALMCHLFFFCSDLCLKSRNETNIRSVGCVGSSPKMGEHLRGVAELWRTGSELSAVQLLKAGMDDGERMETLEKLHLLAQKHSL